ncbi:hypothetical protein O181_090112 [Austropuccinia psidii MF-1]|uniref:Uncharacterized protein n=1 Tax=Austropuccinia psidii MF-1 TaxID=1389203 RepID=A0A9Q3IUX0_9BASI|nr:hypothetical protein [Austropuccinia psidii MF-1]
MHIQHSPPARQTRSQARAQAVLTPTPRASFDGTLEVPQMRAKLNKGHILEGAEPSRKEGRGPRRSNSFWGVVGGFPGTSRTILRGPGEAGEEEEEESDGTEGVPAPVGASLSQPWQLPSWTPYGISVPYQSYGNLAIYIITGQIGTLIVSGLLWSFHSWDQPGPFTIIRPFQAIFCFWTLSGIFQSTGKIQP